MAKLVWDNVGEKRYETGVDHGVLYIQDAGVYSKGYVWNGLSNVSESPSGAEANPIYADNIKYLNLVGTEDFGGTIEAYTYPAEFEECDGTASIATGVTVGQQNRKTFGLSYRTVVGNDVAGNEYGYKLHLVYGCLAAPSERSYATISDSPEPIAFSWTFSTTPVPVTGFKPTALVVVDSTKTTPEKMAALEEILYGTEAKEARLPLPNEVMTLFK